MESRTVSSSWDRLMGTSWSRDAQPLSLLRRSHAVGTAPPAPGTRARHGHGSPRPLGRRRPDDPDHADLRPSSGAGPRGHGGVVTVERAGADDLAMGALSTHGRVPQQFGVVLGLEPGGDAEAVQRLVADRLGTVPRLRQWLVPVPLLAGRPVWVDDPSFAARTHVGRRTCAAPGDERALLDLAAELACVRLDP